MNKICAKIDGETKKLFKNNELPAAKFIKFYEDENQ